MAISLRYIGNGTAHRDVFVTVGEETFVCDSYYFMLDRNVLPDREDDGKVRAVLSRLLEQWLDGVQTLADEGTVHLPYDFSDQCTGWLECRRKGQGVIVSRGWALVEGWSFMPSEIGDLARVPNGFRADGPTVQMTIEGMRKAIRSSLELLG